MKHVRMLLAGLGLMGSGCFVTTYNTGLPGGGEVKTASGSFYVYGLIGETDVNLSSLCPNGVSSWKQNMAVIDAVISCFTCNLYNPTSIEVTCSGGGAAKTSYLLTPDASTHRTLVEPMASSSAQSGDKS